MDALAELTKTQRIDKIEGKHFSAAHAGPFASLGQYSFEHPTLKRKASGKLFLKDHLKMSSMQVSLNRLPAGREVPFKHAHKKNEELYVFVGGKGQMQVDGEIFDVEEGTVVRVAPGGFRTWRNTSDNDLYYICVQARDGSLDGDTFNDGIPSDEKPSWENT